MSAALTELTEIVTGLGMLAPNLDAGLAAKPAALRNVSDDVWARLVGLRAGGAHALSFSSAFDNGAAFLAATDGLRGRAPRLVEWKGPHRPPGDDVVPADLRVDHVYLVSCKYLSKVLLNPGPARLFDRLLVGGDRGPGNWFHTVAPAEYNAFYQAARAKSGLADLPDAPTALATPQQHALKAAFSARTLPAELKPAWAQLCSTVATESAARWNTALSSPRAQLHLLWRLLRMGDAAYFVLGSAKAAHLRLRVASTWDWNQAFQLRTFTVTPRTVGQPEVGWRAVIRSLASGELHEVNGHVEIRWSHGRFVGAPEAKVYLDTPHAEVPGYWPLV